MIKHSELLKLAILKNESEKDHLRWVKACEKYKQYVFYTVIDLTKNDWLGKIMAFQPDIMLVKPGGLTSSFKQLYDERLLILNRELSFRCFPSLEEVLIYENKRYLSYWLEANKIPHPETNVFYYRDEAIKFLTASTLPLVGKVNIGASGSGVTILENINQANEYIIQTFSGKGASKRSGPNLEKGGLLKRGLHYFFHPGDISERLKKYISRASDVQSDFVILQEYIPHDFEWRVVRIGDSFFAHKKMKLGDKASGSLLKKYENPPYKLLDFVKEITDRFNFFSQAIDIFETDQGYLVNEMQCIFGQSDPYQMLVNGIPGRYYFSDGEWIFEAGNFNENESYNLRIEHILREMKQIIK